MIRYTNNLFESAKTIVPKTMKQLKLLKVYQKYRLFYSWSDIVGKDMAKYIVPQDLKFSVLYVYAQSSVWANNFQYLKLEIIGKINDFLQGELVKDIQFTRYRQKNNNNFSPIWEQKIDLGKYIRKTPIDDEDLLEIDKMLVDVDDDDLKNKLKKVYMKSMQLKKLKLQYGWINCKTCGRLIPPKDEYCTNCERKIKEEKKEKIAEILEAIPWAKYPDIVKYVDCDNDLINKVRMNMVQQVASTLRPDVDYPDKKSMNGVYSKKARYLVMLYKVISPDKLSDAVLKEVLKKLKYDTAYWIDRQK